MSAVKDLILKQAERAEQIHRARIIARTLGSRVAAAYLRRRAWSIEAALYIISTVPAKPSRSPQSQKPRSIIRRRS